MSSSSGFSLSTQIQNIKRSATLEINERVKLMRAQGETVTHLGFGESPFPVPERIIKAFQENSFQKSYLPGAGIPELREAISKYYYEQFSISSSPNNILIGPGSKELIFDLLYVLNGTLLLPTPSWVSYLPQARLINKPFIQLPTHFSDNHKLKAETLQKIIESKLPSPNEQKIIIINNPNNPTGAVYAAQELKEIAEVCRKNNIIVISDEIYAKVDFTGQKHVSVAHYYPEKTIITSGLSKYFSAGGYRFGFLILPENSEDLKINLQKIISETFSCICSPLQYAATEAYKNYSLIQEELDRAVKIHNFTTSYVYDRYTKMGIQCTKPEGGFYLVANLDSMREKLEKVGVKTSKELSGYILSEAKVAMLPGSDFGFEESVLSMRVAVTDFSGKEALEQFKFGNNSEDYQHNLKLIPRIIEGCDRLEELINKILS